jgi:hypothetical protein
MAVTKVIVGYAAAVNQVAAWPRIITLARVLLHQDV